MVESPGAGLLHDGEPDMALLSKSTVCPPAASQSTRGLLRNAPLLPPPYDLSAGKYRIATSSCRWSRSISWYL
jgi:hypothetical protein